MADNNTALGVNALGVGPSGSDNVALGVNSLKSASSGAQNIGLGSGAGAAVTTGGSNVLIGYGSTPSLTTGSSNIIIGDGADVPSGPGAGATNSYLNIGGVITGSMVSGGPITLANGFQATTQPSADSSPNIATTAFVHSVVGAATGAVFKLASSGATPINTGSNPLLDLSAYGYDIAVNAYSKLILEIKNITSSDVAILLVEFVSGGPDGTIFSGDTYGAAGGGEASSAITFSSTGNFVCGLSGMTPIDGSVSIQMRGFCNNSTPNVLPNITTKGILYSVQGYYDSSILNICCSNPDNLVIDGLYFYVFEGGASDYQFDWVLYGVI